MANNVRRLLGAAGPGVGKGDCCAAVTTGVASTEVGSGMGVAFVVGVGACVGDGVLVGTDVLVGCGVGVWVGTCTNASACVGVGNGETNNPSRGTTKLAPNMPPASTNVKKASVSVRLAARCESLRTL